MKWNVDPELIRLGPLAIRYYSLFIVVGFVLMGAYVKSLFKKEGKNPEDVSNLTTYIIVGMLVGARLAHCLFYDPGYYFSNPLKILFVWEGGLASHGGYLGVLVSVYLFLKKHPEHKFLHIMDMIAGPCLFVGGLFRLGNLMNSEIVGIPSNVPWAVVFERVDMIPRHPAQIYEAIGYFTISFILAYLYKTKKDLWKQGSVLSVAIILSFTFRFFIEFTKDEQATFMHNPAINMGQWLSIAFVVGGIIWLRVLRHSK